MDIKTLLGLFDTHERIGADYPRYRREVAGSKVRMISLEEGGHHYLAYSRLTEDDADAAIDEELRFFGGLGQGFEWKLYSHDGPPDLKQRLAARGFSVGDDEAVMALELAALPKELTGAHGHDVRKVVDEQGIADYARLNAEAWPDDDEAWANSLATTLRQKLERMSAWVAYVEGRPVCAARIDFPGHSPFASLWGGATLEGFRKRGLYTAVLAERAREAIARGYRFLTIDASPMSRPIVERHGFRLLAISNPCDSPKA